MQNQSTFFSGLLWPKIIFCALVVLALTLRLLALDAISESIYATFLLPDEQYYHDWAIEILQGKPSLHAFEYAPLPAYLLALIYKISSVDPINFRVANIFFNTLGCVFIYFIAKSLAGRNWALLALALAACSGELIFYSVVPLKTSLSFLLFAGVIHLVLLLLRHSSRILFFSLGIVLGLSAMVRPNVVILLPGIILVIIVFHESLLLKKSLVPLLITGGFLFASLPLPLHNYLSSKHFSFLPVQSGFLFYCTNNIDNPTPFYRPVSFASSHPEEQGIQFTIEASKREQRALDSSQAAQYWQKQVIREALDHPQFFLKKLGLKTLMLFNFSENGDHYNIGFIRNIIPYFNMLLPQYWIVALLGYTAIVVGCFRSPQIKGLAIILCSYLLTLVLYSSGNRFNLPLLAIFIPASVWLCRHICQLFSTRKLREIVTITLLVVIFCFIGRLKVEGADDLSYHYNLLAFIHNKNNNSAKAVHYWEESKKLNQSYSDTPSLFLAGYYYQRYGKQKAIATLHSIPDNSFHGSAKYLTLGDIYKHHGQYDMAAQAYRKSLDINSGQLRARKELISILARIDPSRIGEEVATLKYIQTFYKKD